MPFPIPQPTLYALIAQLESLIAKWENKPYTGDLTKAIYSICAKELRQITGKPNAATH